MFINDFVSPHCSTHDDNAAQQKCARTLPVYMRMREYTHTRQPVAVDNSSTSGTSSGRPTTSISSKMSSRLYILQQLSRYDTGRHRSPKQLVFTSHTILQSELALRRTVPALLTVLFDDGRINRRHEFVHHELLHLALSQLTTAGQIAE
jgi:hypothetical protein